MDPMVGAIVAAVAGSLGAYLVAVRRFSGKIESSDAAELWKESSAIREWSSGQLTALTTHVHALERRIQGLEDSNADLARENRVLLGENERLKGQVRALSTELASCRSRVTELEAQVGG